MGQRALQEPVSRLGGDLDTLLQQCKHTVSFASLLASVTVRTCLSTLPTICLCTSWQETSSCPAIGFPALTSKSPCHLSSGLEKGWKECRFSSFPPCPWDFFFLQQFQPWCNNVLMFLSAQRSLGYIIVPGLARYQTHCGCLFGLQSLFSPAHWVLDFQDPWDASHQVPWQATWS